MKTLLLVILFLFTSSAWAEWITIGENDADTLYIDFASLKPSGQIRKIQELQDFKQRGKDGAMSVLTKSEYDCEKLSYRVLAVTIYSGSMATGKKLSTKTANPKAWVLVVPQTDSETVFETVCAQ